MSTKILVAEDEEIARDNLVHILSKEGFEIIAVDNGQKAIQQLAKTEFDLVITDLKMPDINGMEVLEHVRNNYPATEILMITGYASVSSAVEAMRKGAYSYIAKPFKLEELRIMVQRALEKRSLFQEVSQLRERVESSSFPKFVGQSEKIKLLKETITQIASVDCNVLISGETGTGKEMVARSIHSLSPRSERRFVAVNCASLNEELLGNELFGHEAGAFTGAKSSKEGLFEVANGGTFFLDEIGDMPIGMQAQLLRVLEERTMIRLGGTKDISIDVRILAATNKDLIKEVEQKTFRKDLFYRLNVVNIHIPPLSERKDDIPLLAYYFLNKRNSMLNKQVSSFSADAIRLLESYAYPGNVRELENIVERAVVLCTGDTILPVHLPSDLKDKQLIVKKVEPEEWTTLVERERDYIERVLEHTGGNKTQAAKLLGIDRVSLWRKISRYEIE